MSTKTKLDMMSVIFGFKKTSIGFKETILKMNDDIDSYIVLQINELVWFN